MELKLDGIGTIKELAFKDKQLLVKMSLAGLEDRPIEIGCGRIEISPTGDSIKLSEFSSNMPFMLNALNKFLTEPIAIPEGDTRQGLLAAKTLLDL